MTIANAAELKNRVRALLRDTSKRHTCAGLGFVAEAPLPKGALVGGLVDDAWNLFDLRGADAEHARARLGEAIAAGAKKPAVVVVDGNAPRAALSFAQALADRAAGVSGSSVDLGDHVTRELPANMSAVVVVEGVNDHDKLPRPLQRVDYWEML